MTDAKTLGIISISMLFILAASYSYYQYSQALPIEQERNELQRTKSTLEQEKASAIDEVEGLRSSMSQLQSAEDANRNKIQELTNTNSYLESQNSALQNRNGDLTEENTRLISANLRLMINQQTMTLQPSPNLGEALNQLNLISQTGEVVFYRQLQVYNYKTGEQWRFHWDIPFQPYYHYRSNTEGHNLPYIDSAESVEYYQTSLSTWRDLTTLAEGLRKYSGSDDEVYANMVLQVTHQFLYKPTDKTKYPIETFVEGSGDCDTLAVFAAALMKAGGLDSAIIYGTANGSEEDQLGVAHAMVGVNLDEEPNDHLRTFSWYIEDENGKEYYLAEATWGSGVFVDPWDYTIEGSAVGDSPWVDFEGIIVETPNT